MLPSGSQAAPCSQRTALKGPFVWACDEIAQLAEKRTSQQRLIFMALKVETSLKTQHYVRIYMKKPRFEVNQG